MPNSLLNFLVLWLPCLSCTNVEEYIRKPGPVSALLGKKSLLSFLPALPNNEIFWCYWEYSPCERSEGCPIDSFIGYNKYDGRRENISRRHDGWMFENVDMPCQGGISKVETEEQDQGWYQMIFDDQNRTEYKSGFFSLTLYEERTLNVTISINHVTEHVPLPGRKGEQINLPAVSGVKGVTYSITVTLTPDRPPNTEVSIRKSNSEGTSMFVSQCFLADGRVCEFEAGLSEEDDVLITVGVDFGIQGLPSLEIRQPFKYSGTSKHGGWILAGIALFLLVALVLAILLTVWVKQRRKEMASSCSTYFKRDSQHGLETMSQPVLGDTPQKAYDLRDSEVPENCPAPVVGEQQDIHGLSIIKGLVDSTFTSGQPAKLSVEATGNEPLSAKWYKDNGRLGSTVHGEITREVNGAFTYQIKEMRGICQGRYKCEITDSDEITQDTSAYVKVVS